jgi:hypothetical protein
MYTILEQLAGSSNVYTASLQIRGQEPTVERCSAKCRDLHVLTGSQHSLSPPGTLQQLNGGKMASVIVM